MPQFCKDPKFYRFPPKFKEYRDCQVTAIDFILNSQKNRIVCAVPTGGGKSLAYVTAIKAGRLGRTLILTSTKALQKQLMDDFASMGLVTVEGKNNYPCDDQMGLINCDLGPCHFGYECELKKGGCKYFDALDRARNSQIVVTNYHYYLAMAQTGNSERGLGEFDTVICDEGHELPLILADNMALDFPIEEYRKISQYEMKDLGNDISSWERWARVGLDEVLGDLQMYKNAIAGKFSAKLAKEIAIREKFEKYFRRIISMIDNDHYTWYVDYGETTVKFGPVKFPAYWGEWEFLSDFNKAIIVSATAREKTMQILGVPRDSYDFLDMDSVFPKENSPKIHVNTIQFNRHTSEKQFIDRIVGAIDKILDNRKDRKGIIHTTSYRWAEVIFANSRHAHAMFFPRNARERAGIIKRFKSASAPCALIGPALVTGYDFPGDECLFQIITKTPYPNFGDKFLMERSNYDKLFIPYMVAQSLVQITGRGTRTATDKCENIFLDNSILGFIQRHKAMFPKWWLDSFQATQIIPRPKF